VVHFHLPSTFLAFSSLLLPALGRSQQTLADSRISLVHYVTKLLECKLFCQDHLKARHEQLADDVDAATVNQVRHPPCFQRRLHCGINTTAANHRRKSFLFTQLMTK
jgi:hypothetical protein